MNTTDPSIDPRLDRLPTEGKVEFLRWSETFHRLTTAYLKNAEKLSEIKELDPAYAEIYDREIESLQEKASETMEQWQAHRDRILSKFVLLLSYCAEAAAAGHPQPIPAASLSKVKSHRKIRAKKTVILPGWPFFVYTAPSAPTSSAPFA